MNSAVKQRDDNSCDDIVKSVIVKRIILLSYKV